MCRDRLHLYRTIAVPHPDYLVELLAANITVPQHFGELDRDR